MACQQHVTHLSGNFTRNPAALYLLGTGIEWSGAARERERSVRQPSSISSQSRSRRGEEFTMTSAAVRAELGRILEESRRSLLTDIQFDYKYDTYKCGHGLGGKFDK